MILITVIQVYVPTTDAKEAEVDWFYEDLQDLLLECKSRSQADTWSNRQV